MVAEQPEKSTQTNKKKPYLKAPISVLSKPDHEAASLIVSFSIFKLAASYKTSEHMENIAKGASQCKEWDTDGHGLWATASDQLDISLHADYDVDTAVENMSQIDTVGFQDFIIDTGIFFSFRDDPNRSFRDLRFYCAIKAALGRDKVVQRSLVAIARLAFGKRQGDSSFKLTDSMRKQAEWSLHRLERDGLAFKLTPPGTNRTYFSTQLSGVNLENKVVEIEARRDIQKHRKARANEIDAFKAKKDLYTKQLLE